MGLRFFKYTWIAGVFFLLSACGYHLEGRPENFNPRWHSIYISVWENPTADIRFGEIMAEALRERFALAGSLRLAEKDKADLVLQGKVISIAVGGLSYDVYTKTLERRVTVRAKATLIERATGRVIWRNDNISRFEDYPVSTATSGGSLDPGREEALRQVAHDLAEIIYHQITSSF